MRNRCEVASVVLDEFLSGMPYPSNESRDHMRNVIRHDMMPTVLKVNPGVEKVLRKKVQNVFEMRQKLYKSTPIDVCL